jgi:hypothetical protein
VRDPFGLHVEEEDDDGATRRLGPAARAGLVAAVLLVGGAVLFAGAAGLVVALSVLAGAAVLALGLRLPAAPPLRRRRRPAPRVDNAAYGSFRDVAEKLSWAAVSPRHYDVVTRPLLTRLAAARLADTRRVDLYADPDAARAVLGEDVWPWVDPAREPVRDSQPPGVPRETLTRIVERLEAL